MMQDDEAFDRGFRRAMEDHTPFYVGYLISDGTICLHDEATGAFPDKPEGCYERVKAERKARHAVQDERRYDGLGVVVRLDQMANTVEQMIGRLVRMEEGTGIDLEAGRGYAALLLEWLKETADREEGR